jgi:hypothetical protein
MIHRDSVTVQCVLSFPAQRLFSLVKNEAKRPPRFRSDSNAVPDSSRNEWSRQEPLLLYAAPLQFGFYRVKEDLGWHHCKIGPEDDRSARGD